MYNPRLEVNIDAVEAGADAIGRISLGRIQGIAQKIARELLLEVMAEAALAADYDDGFPMEYTNHLMDATRRLPITVIADQYEIFVAVDFEELGDQDDLERAYHQGAKLADGSTLWGPYTGQALRNDSSVSRHVYWEAVRRGDDEVTIESDGRVKTLKIRPGAWEETKDQYLRIWGSKAPEWLLIQFGQEEWPPYVGQYDIIGEFAYRLRNDMTALLEIEVDYEVATANLYQSQGVSVGFTKRGQPRLSAGQSLTIGGKTYKPGQFVPKS